MELRNIVKEIMASSKASMIKRLGSLAAYNEYMRTIASKGGKTLGTGFATLSQEKRQRISKLGNEAQRKKREAR